MDMQVWCMCGWLNTPEIRYLSVQEEMLIWILIIVACACMSIVHSTVWTFCFLLVCMTAHVDMYKLSPLSDTYKQQMATSKRIFWYRLQVVAAQYSGPISSLAWPAICFDTVCYQMHPMANMDHSSAPLCQLYVRRNAVLPAPVPDTWASSNAPATTPHSCHHLIPL